MTDLYLIVEIDGQKAVLPASCIESVVEMGEVTPVPCAPRHVLGLFALRSRVMTVIDTRAALGADVRPGGRAVQAVIVTMGDHLYGFVVDHVDDVVPIDGAPAPARALLSPGWAAMSAGILEHDGMPMIVLDVDALISGKPTALAA
ncbi:chemotaxis protein CheW [Sphingomonas montanisoli]|uniref:Chemotaxis protein CheW n=2 Tax=Sphingomonas montanisoli TaxID=2606412 RepID=A0A5D9CE33_9SPHN|nr:chemotaxis protein CheW [Sphingomonas montanisoli]